MRYNMTHRFFNLYLDGELLVSPRAHERRNQPFHGHPACLEGVIEFDELHRIFSTEAETIVLKVPNEKDLVYHRGSDIADRHWRTLVYSKT